jgi:uncharacterized protein YndB with AHSA1/START domain
VKFSPIEGSGAAEVAIPPAAAFAYLADPRHAPEWFAGAAFAAPPEGAPRLGQNWSFARTRGTRRVLPVAVAAFEPPRHFLWQTTLGPRRDNNAWEVECVPTAAAATRLTVTIRLIPGPLGWLSILLYRPLVRAALRERAQRAADRARDALLAHAAASPTPPAHPRPHPRAGRKPRRPRR